MRFRVGRGVVAAIGLLAASACAGDPPSAPSPQPPAEPLKVLSIVWDVPGVIVIGDAPFRIQPVVFISGGVGYRPLESVKCNPTWSSSEPAYATVSAGVLEARSIGATTIAVTCQGLRIERNVFVRRRLAGTVSAADSRLPIEGAIVSIASALDFGTETRTDNAGRFTLIVPSEFDLKATAVDFDVVRQRVEATQRTVQLTLSPLPAPSPLSFRWEGWFERPIMTSRAIRFPEGTLDGFEFETHHTGEFSLAVSASCRTEGNDETFGVSMHDDRGKAMIWTSTTRAGSIGRVSKTLPPGRYRVSIPALNWNALPPCTWWVELVRPR
jgi:hypothetical protein